MFGICYQPPNQDDEADETLFWLLKEVSGQQNLVLKGDLNHANNCCEKNTAVVHPTTARQEQLQLWALIHTLPLSSYRGGDEGDHASLTEVSAPLVRCLHSPVTQLSPKCLSDCQSEFSLSGTSGVVPLSPKSPWPPCLLLQPQGHLHPFVVSLELNTPSKRMGYAALPLSKCSALQLTCTVSYVSKALLALRACVGKHITETSHEKLQDVFCKDNKLY